MSFRVGRWSFEYSLSMGLGVIFMGMGVGLDIVFWFLGISG